MDNFIKSVYAGFMIGIGGIIYLSLDNPIIAAFLFSFGLLTIIIQQFNLFTGKIGFVKTKEQLKAIPIIIIGNFIGTFLTSVFAELGNLPISADIICANKLNKDIFSIFILAMFCGIMMYLAVDNYNKTKNVIFIILPVVIFILSGFEHSIANMFYFSLAGVWSVKAVVYILIMICGNAFGALIFNYIKEKKMFKIDEKLSELITRKYDNTGLVISIEECSELQKTITKYLRGKGDYENICEEMADVIICLDWLQHILDIKEEDIQHWIDFKTERTLNRISEGVFN